jgi:hypothetical protein
MLGPRAAYTGQDGRFRFDDAPAGDIVVSQLSLGGGMVARAAADRGARMFEIPVVRTGRISVRVRLDDGTGAAELPAHGAQVRVVDADGRVRAADADEDGAVAFESLLPGNTTITVTPPPGRGAAEPVSVTVTLEQGATSEVTVSLLQRARPVRFFDGTGAALPAATTGEPASPGG